LPQGAGGAAKPSEVQESLWTQGCEQRTHLGDTGAGQTYGGAAEASTSTSAVSHETVQNNVLLLLCVATSV
jgi:hypothetical protein